MARMTFQQAMDLGLSHHRDGRLKEAESIYRQIIAADPRQSDAFHFLAIVALQSGRVDAALELLGRALALEPNSADYHNTLGQSLLMAGRREEGIAAFRKAIEFRSPFPEASINLAVALYQSNHVKHGIEVCRQLIRQIPEHSQAWNNLGIMLRDQNNMDEAIGAFYKAIQFKPDNADATTNLGNALREVGRFDEAVESLRKAVELSPQWPIAHHNLGSNLLLNGQWEQGWTEFEWRCRIKHPQPVCLDFPRPRWDGGAIKGRTILVHAEQGLGDTIQFIRYLPRVVERGASIVLMCQPPLKKLLIDFPGLKQLITTSDPSPEVDCHCPLMSLPVIFKTTLDAVPADIPYLKADSDLSFKWRQRLADITTKKKVGLVWAGRKAHIEDRTRSMALSVLSPLAKVHDIYFISLQKDLSPEQSSHPSFTSNWFDRTNELNDFADTAALIDRLDLVISVDTAIAHLAGAMGKPVWLLLSYVPDWRWMLHREDTPWYPTMKLFRQKTLGDWQPVVERVMQELACLK
ncbi:MAG TPA: tetratricopeptide repeat protein [Tepidisphaeraceae bacterium]|nr:tetratricopeptide repeat protein [Tepidisphaeraceae bacterium]